VTSTAVFAAALLRELSTIDDLRLDTTAVLLSNFVTPIARRDAGKSTDERRSSHDAIFDRCARRAARPVPGQRSTWRIEKSRSLLRHVDIHRPAPDRVEQIGGHEIRMQSAVVSSADRRWSIVLQQRERNGWWRYGRSGEVLRDQIDLANAPATKVARFGDEVAVGRLSCRPANLRNNAEGALVIAASEIFK